MTSTEGEGKGSSGSGSTLWGFVVWDVLDVDGDGSGSIGDSDGDGRGARVVPTVGGAVFNVMFVSALFWSVC